MRVTLALACLLTGCGSGVPTLDDLVRGKGVAGQAYTVRGKLKDVTWIKRQNPERIVLIAAEDDRGLGEAAREWGLGARLAASQLTSRTWRLPQRGDTVEVSGTLTTFERGGADRPVLEQLTAFSVAEAAAALADIGAACARDSDCQDDLWCERGGTCAKIPELTWDSAERNIHGTCVTDADCGIGQICDPGYLVPATGDFSPPYHASRDVGRKLCQVVDKTQASLCPRTTDIQAVLGARFPEGKEVCLRSTIAYALFNPSDRDTHVQNKIPSPALFPIGEPAIETFGASTENVPMRKDPAVPGGALPDPVADDEVVMFGTVHYDDSHDWWELHPIKWWKKL